MYKERFVFSLHPDSGVVLLQSICPCLQNIPSRPPVLRRGCGGSSANLAGCDPDGGRNTDCGGNRARRGGVRSGRLFCVHAATINASDPNTNSARRGTGGNGGGGGWNRCRGSRLCGGVAGAGGAAIVDTDDGSDFVFSDDALFVGARFGGSARAIIVIVIIIIIVLIIIFTSWREAGSRRRYTTRNEARGGWRGGQPELR